MRGRGLDSPVLFGFFSDSHGDLEATGLCLAALECADRLYFLGDVAGGRDVEACLEVMNERGVQMVSGNHDLWDFELIGLPKSCREQIAGLPLQFQDGDFLAVHSYYTRHNDVVRFEYLYTEQDAEKAFEFFPQSLVFVGHTHQARVFQLDGPTVEGSELQQPLRLSEHHRYLVNVGCAQDGVVIYDSQDRVVRFLFHPV